jgi:hypothetical protein
MPPAKRNHDDVQTLKEKLQGSNARGRRTQGATSQPATSSALKEVDNASTNSGHTAHDTTSSHVSHTTPPATFTTPTTPTTTPHPPPLSCLPLTHPPSR